MSPASSPTTFMHQQSYAIAERDGGKYQNQAANGLPTMKWRELTALENAEYHMSEKTQINWRQFKAE